MVREWCNPHIKSCNDHDSIVDIGERILIPTMQRTRRIHYQRTGNKSFLQSGTHMYQITEYQGMSLIQ